MAENVLQKFAQLQRENPSGFVEGGQFFKSQADFDRGQAIDRGGQATPLNFDTVLQRATQLAQQAVQPAISSLTASIPETQARFTQERTRLEGQAQPLTARYESLLNDIKGKQQTSTEQQTLATSRELGRRGVSTTSGLGEQEITSALAPITRDYAGLIQQTGLSREADLASLQNQITELTGQETEATRSIRNAIAQLQSGAATGAVPTALDLINKQQQAEQFQQTFSEGQRQFDTSAELSRKAKELSSQAENRVSSFLSALQQGTTPATEGIITSPTAMLDDRTKQSLFDTTFLSGTGTQTQGLGNRISSNLSLIPQGLSKILNSIIPTYGLQPGAGKNSNSLLATILRGGR